ncbi:hypothetical protein MASR1M60_33160 [Rhodocyclaceae bacterium]
MKAVAKLVVILGLMAGFTAHAADGARREAVLDTGKGGVKLVMSVPGWADGPYDFGKNPGAKVKSVANLIHGEALFNAGVTDSSVVVYQAVVGRRTSAKQGDQPITAEHLANEMLKTNGFTTARAVKIDSPDAGINGATVVAYKASGYSIWDGKEDRRDKAVMIVMAVSPQNQTQGFAIASRVVEKDVGKFDADPAKYEKAAMKAFTDIFKNSNWSVN